MNSISIKQALAFAFSTLRTRYGLLFILFIISIIIPAIIFVVPLITLLLPAGIMSQFVQPTIPPQLFQTVASPLLIVLIVVALIIALFLYIWGMLCITDVLLHLHEGVAWSRLQLHHLRALVIPALGATFIYRIGQLILSLLFIIPGIIWVLTVGFYWFALVDEHQEAIASLKESARLTKGNRLKLLAFYSLFFFLAVVVGAVMRIAPGRQFPVPSRMLDLMSALITGIIHAILILAEIDIYFQLKHHYALTKKA